MTLEPLGRLRARLAQIEEALGNAAIDAGFLEPEDDAGVLGDRLEDLREQVASLSEVLGDASWLSDFVDLDGWTDYVFTTVGVPRPQGSKTLMMPGGRPRLVDAAKGMREWREAVADAFRAEYEFLTPVVGRVALVVEFIFPRPKSHFTAGGKLKKMAPKRFEHAQSPDLDKLVRAIGDALTGEAWKDDRFVRSCLASRSWATPGETPDELLDGGAIVHVLVPPEDD